MWCFSVVSFLTPWCTVHPHSHPLCLLQRPHTADLPNLSPLPLILELSPAAHTSWLFFLFIDLLVLCFNCLLRIRDQTRWSSAMIRNIEAVSRYSNIIVAPLQPILFLDTYLWIQLSSSTRWQLLVLYSTSLSYQGAMNNQNGSMSTPISLFIFNSFKLEL